MQPAIIFDLGKVLVDFDYTIAAKKIAARSTISMDNLHDFLSSSPLLVQLETGLLTPQQFYSEIQKATGFNGSADEFSGYFTDIFEPMPPMVELHAALRKRQIPTYIFSNTSDIAVGHIRRQF